MKKAKQAKTAVVETAPAPCWRCGGTDLIQITAKCSDLCLIRRGGKAEWGYVPEGIGLGDDPNYVEFTYCRKCGHIQNAEFKAL